MKQKVLIRSLIAGASLLLLGTLAVETADRLYIEPRTVSSWSELVDCYLVSRTSLPPLPFAYDDALADMQTGDWSFLSDHWQYMQADGIYYAAQDSGLAELKLPLHIRVYEDIRRGEIVVLSSADGINFQGEALFNAPEFMPHEKDCPPERYAFDELAPRRIIWEIILKSETDAWTDLLWQCDEAAVSGLSGEGEMMSMSVPAEHTNCLWLYLGVQDQTVSLNIYAPEGFTNRVEVYSSTNLVSGFWSVAEQNFYPGTNPAAWEVTSNISNRFFRAGNMDIDSDSDGINDARELIIYQSNPNSANSDGDAYSDYEEIHVYFTDPGNDDTVAPAVSLTVPFSGERKAVLP